MKVCIPTLFNATRPSNTQLSAPPSSSLEHRLLVSHPARVIRSLASCLENNTPFLSPSHWSLHSPQSLFNMDPETPLPPLRDTPNLTHEFKLLSRDLASLRRLKDLYGSSPKITEMYNQRKADQRNSAGSRDISQGHALQFSKAMGEINERRGGIFSSGVSRFLDLGSAPGGFSSYLLDHNRESTGVGITILPDSETHIIYVAPLPVLEDPKRYTTHYMDVLNLAKEYITSTPSISFHRLLSHDQTFDLIIAGAFGTAEHSACSSVVKARLGISQLFIALHHLEAGGNLLMVMSTTPRLWTLELLGFLDEFFDSMSAAKGKKLHSTRSTCYMVCRGFKSKKREAGIESLKVVLKTLEELLVPKAHPLSQDGGEWQSRSSLFDPLRSGSQAFDANKSLFLEVLEPLWRFQYNNLYSDLKWRDPDYLSVCRSTGPPLPRMLQKSSLPPIYIPPRKASQPSHSSFSPVISPMSPKSPTSPTRSDLSRNWRARRPSVTFSSESDSGSPVTPTSPFNSHPAFRFHKGGGGEDISGGYDRTSRAQRYLPEREESSKGWRGS